MAMLGAAVISATDLLTHYFIKRRKNNENNVQKQQLTAQEWRARFDKIHRRYDQKLGIIAIDVLYITSYGFPVKSRRLKKKFPHKFGLWRNFKKSHSIWLEFSIQRTLASMDYRHRETCRILELTELGLVRRRDSANLRAAIIWGDGKAQLNSFKYHVRTKISRITDGVSAVKWFLEMVCYYQNVDAALSSLLDTVNNAHPNDVIAQEIKRRLNAGNAWLDASQFDGAGFANQPSGRGGLYLGKTEDNINCWFTGEGSLITVAPPGAGKTQTHVIPNLLSWKGPAIVLDVKGELWDKTAAYRATLGPVYRFSPLDPDHSHRFNPLCYIRNDPDYLWEDSKYLADLIVVRSDAKDPFWENRALDLITAAIAVEYLNTAPEQRDMATVVGYCYGRDWADMLAKLELSPVNAMRNAAEGWINATGSGEKTLDGIRQQAQTFMSAWEGSRVERATKTSDWHPLELREKPVTLYIALKAGEIDAYASLLRVFVGVHIRTLIQTLPPQGAQDILLMLDELPRLKYMPAIEEAVELGRQYKLKLFMIIQSIGQLKKHYKNSDGLIGSCAVRAYMNPSASDGTAEKLTKEFGQIESIVDGSRRNLAEINDLTGPDYKDAVLVLSSGNKPLKLNKTFAYQNQTLQKWMESDPPTIQKGKVVETPDLDSQNKSISTKGVY